MWVTGSKVKMMPGEKDLTGFEDGKRRPRVKRRQETDYSLELSEG
jgi:hypothetical protein